MEISWRVLCFCIGLGIIELCNGLPIELFSTNEGPNAQLIGVLVAVMVSVCVVLAFVGCACCQRRRGFKEFRDSPVTASVVNDSTLTVDDPGHVNPIASSEFTIFTPLSPPHHNNNVFRTHHQPVISYIQNEIVPETQNKLNNTQIDGLDVSSWFDGSQSDFPRTKLKYIRELGSGWFGRVVEGEAQGINNNHDDGWTPVAVRILESSASAHEQALFLHEASIYRIEQPHQHVLKLWGRSLEATPLLLIQEFCPRGDLKKFLLENQSCSTSPVMLGLPLQFCCQLASALQYLHDNNIPHLDLAARTCQITSDMALKLGDYGLAVSRYSRDYYQGTPAIPVRWCAPESLNYTNTTLQPKQVTLAGNIWSLGVTMWEICEWGAQPYDWLTDDEVVSQVMGAPHIRLPQPNLSVYYIHPLYRLMQLCWQNSESRPLIPQIYAMLLHLMQTYQQENSSKSPSKIPEFSIEDFDSRWDTFKPNTIVKTDNHISSDVKLTGCTDKTTDLTSLSSTSEVYMNPSVRKSDSLTNLHGSFENLTDDADTPVQNMDSWLQNVASHTGDMQYVRGLSQAIQALDSALALEQTSSSGSSYQHSPAPEHWDTRTPPNKPQQPKIEFKLGLTQKSSADDSTNMMDSIFLARRSESGSETEDETWRKRIERGAYSEKVRQKSKSVADLMVLTHIDCSDTDSETPLQSLEYKVNKNVRCVTKNSLENSSLMFGSEGNLLAVQDTFQEELRKLQEERRDSLLFVPARHSSDGDITGSVSADVHQCISRNDCDNHTIDNVLDLSDIMLHGSFVTSDIVYSTPEKKYSQSYTQNSDQISSSDIVKHAVPVSETQTSDTSSTHTSLSACVTDQKLTESKVIQTTEVTDKLSDVTSKPSDFVTDQNLSKSTSAQSCKTSEIVSPIKSADYLNINQKLIQFEQENTSELLDNLPKLDISEKLISQTVNARPPSQENNENISSYCSADLKHAKTDISDTGKITSEPNSASSTSDLKSNTVLIASNNDESENPCISDRNPAESDLNATYSTSETRQIPQSERKSDLISTDPISAGTELNLSDCSSQSRGSRVDIFEGISDDSVIPDTSLSSSSLTDIDHKPQHSSDSNLEIDESEMKPDTVDRVESIIGSMHTSQPLDISKTVDFLRNEQESESFHCNPEIEHINTIEGCEESLSKNEENLTDAKSQDIVETDVIHESSQVTKDKDTHKESNEDCVSPVKEESKINLLEEIHKESSVELLSLAKENVEINEQNSKLEDTKVVSDSSLDKDIKEVVPEQQPNVLIEDTLGTSSVKETTVDNSVSESNIVHIKEETSMASNILSSSEDSFENITKEIITPETTNLSAQIEEFLQNEQLFQPPSPILIPVNSEPSNEKIIATSVLYPNVKPTEKLDLVDISMPLESSQSEANSVESSSTKVNEENITHMKPSDEVVSHNAKIETVEQFLNKTIENNRNVESESNNIEITIDQSKEPRIQFEDSQPMEQSVDILSKEPSSYLQDQNLVEITSEVEIKLSDPSMNNDSSVPEKLVVDEHPKSEVIHHTLLSDPDVLKSEEKEESTKNSEVTALTTDVDLVPEIAKELEIEHEKVDLDFTNLPTEIIQSKLSEDANQRTTEEAQSQQILEQSEQDNEASDINNESFKNIVVPLPDINHKIITSQFLCSEQEYANSQPENLSSPVIIISKVEPEISPMEIKNSNLTDIDQSVVEVDENESSSNVVLDQITAVVESQQASKESDIEQDIDTTNKREIIMTTTIPESQHDISKTVLPSCTDADNVINDSKQFSTVTYIPSETESQKDHQYPVESPQEEVKTDVITSEMNKPFLRRIPTIIIEDVEDDTEDPIVDYETLITYAQNKDKQNESILEHDTEQNDESLIEQRPNVQSIENNADKNLIESFIANEIAASVVPVNTNTLTNKEVKDIINKDAINSSLDCAENVKSQSAENADDVEIIKLGNEEITMQDSGVMDEYKKLETSANNEYAISTIREGTQLDESYVEQKLNDVESTHAYENCKSEALVVEAKSKEDRVAETLVNTLKDEENSAIKSDITKCTTEVMTAFTTSLSEKINDGKNEVEEVPELSDEIDKISDKASSASKTDDSLEKLTEIDNSDSVQETMTQMHETVSDNIIDRPEVKEETLIEANLTACDNESRSLEVKSDEEDRYSESDILSALENEDELCAKETDKSTLETQNIEEANANNKQSQTDDERKAQFSLIQNFINTERNFVSKDVDFVPSILDPKVELVKDESGSNKENEITNVVQDTTSSLLDLDTLNDPSNVHQMNQVYNVFSVTVDHRPPVECFTSPVKNLYNKVFDQHELMTDINDLLLENDRKLIEKKSPEKLISDLSSVCTSSLPNEQLLNVLNNPPLVNGFDNEINDKFIVEGKNINCILEDCVTPQKTKSNYDITKTPATNGQLNVTKTIPEIIENSPTSNSKETQFNEVNRCEGIRKEQVTDLDDSDDSFTENRNELAPDNTMNTLMTSTPFTKKFIPTKSDDDCKDNIFSFVSEGDEQNSDFQTTVILGPCEDYTLGLYSGLKTTFEKYADDDRPEEELLQFSSNFMPFDEDKAALKINEVNDKYFENNRTFDMNQSVDYSLETWDRFLGKSLLDQQQNSVFDNFSPKPEGVDIFRDKENKQSEVKSENDEQSKQLDSTYNCKETSPADKVENENRTFILDKTYDKENKQSEVKSENDEQSKQLDSTYNCKETSPADKVENENRTFILDKTYDKDVVKETSPDQVVSSSWEPGEGWFLHPQVPPEDLTGQIDISTSDNVDNSYVGFTLDEECVNALRSELAAKLPHAQGMTHEEQQEQDDWDAEERSEIIVKYNVYATPLSPIPEESFCDDAYSDQIQNRDGSDSESDWSEPCMGRTSQLEDILVVDTETHTALILESPSLREPQHRHTPSQDSCCSNDTLFNLEDLNYGPIDADNNSPHHHALTAQSSQSSEQEDFILQVEVTDNETLKLSLSNDDEEDAELPSQKEDLQEEQLDLTISSDSVEDINITYTKPEINIDIADVKSLQEDDHSSEKEYVNSEKEEPVSSVLVSEATEEKSTEDKPSESKSSHKLELKLEPGAFGVAPLPSPEDIPWRQLPASLLTYNEVVQNDKFDIQQESDNAQSEEMDVVNDDESIEIIADTNIGQDNTKLEEDLSDSVPEGVLDTDLYSNLTDIRFSGPCDTQLMSTSFSESADYAEERDWDSGSDTRSSSSGEFIWKEGEHEESLRALHAASHDVGVTEDLNPMDAIEEENTDSSNDDSDDDDGDEDIEETEFVPSAWDAQATPTKSALRSPEKSNKRKNQQKGVWFKKQKYHCVYEYPREPESPVAPNTDLWRPLSDFSNFTDWELDPESCVPPFEDQATTECRDSGYDTVLDKYISRTNYPLASGSARHRDLYQLNPFPDFATGITGTDEDFFISSSARPFQTLGQGSQFFPGQDTKSKGPWQEYQSSSSQSSKDYSDNITPDSGVEDVTPASISDITLSQQLVQLSPPKTKVQSLKHLAAVAANKTASNDTKVQDSLGGLRHTRNRLKLDLPPSPNSFTSNRTFTIDVPNDPVVNREVPTFTTFGKSRFSVQHVQTPTEDVESTATGIQTKSKNVSFEALPYKPMHVSSSNSVYILDNADRNGKHKPVEMVQGEASLLDSADEDSGIESSANATLERHHQQVFH